jgi:hypothetical protein
MLTCLEGVDSALDDEVSLAEAATASKKKKKNKVSTIKFLVFISRNIPTKIEQA